MNILQKHAAILRSKIKTLALSGLLLGSVAVVQAQQLPQFAAPQTNPFGLQFLPSPAFQSVATIATGDLDNDGDLDIVASHTDGSNLGFMEYYYIENTGTAIAPAFALPRTNPFGLQPGFYEGTPQLVDLDNDGDLDIMDMNGENGGFRYYQNTGTAAVPNFATGQTNPFTLSSVPSALAEKSSVELKDLDGDGDMDILVTRMGSYLYYENTGTVSAPVFASPASAPFGLGQPINPYYGRSFSTFADTDADGDFDLFWGGFVDRNIYYQENIGTTAVPNYAASVSNPFGLVATDTFGVYVELADLDGDGDLDLLVGNESRNFIYYQDTGCLVSGQVTISNDTLRAVSNSTGLTYQWHNCATGMNVAGANSANFVPNMSGQFAVILTKGSCIGTTACSNFIYSGAAQVVENQLVVFPNPTKNSFTISLQKEVTNANLRIVDVQGKTVMQQQNLNGSRFEINISNLPTAIYVVEIEHNSTIIRQKIAKQ